MTFSRCLPPPDTRSSQNIPNASEVSDEVPAEADEPPDHRSTPTIPAHPTLRSNKIPYFSKTQCPKVAAKTSLLSMNLLERETPVPPSILCRRSSRSVLAAGTQSVWSVGSTSTAELTSGGSHTSETRPNTPSPPPPTNRGLSCRFVLPNEHNQNTSHTPRRRPSTSAHFHESDPDPEQRLTATLGRSRCISFAQAPCIKPPRGAHHPSSPSKLVSPPPSIISANGGEVTSPRKMPTIRFACSVVSQSTEPQGRAETSNTATSTLGSSSTPQPPHQSTWTHTTPFIAAPSTQAKCTLGAVVSTGICEFSSNGHFTDRLGIDTRRFHEFAESENDDDTPHAPPVFPNRLTISDTLRKENELRKLGQEVEDEEEVELDLDTDDDDATDDATDDEDDDDEGTDDSEDTGDDADNDDEDEEIVSSDEAHTFPQPRAIPNAVPHLMANDISLYRSYSSAASQSYQPDAPLSQPFMIPRQSHHHQSNLPASFPNPSIDPIISDDDDDDDEELVWGTLDEDQPIKEQYLNRLRQSRKLTLQDIDPTFPPSDPEIDYDDGLATEDGEEDDDGDDDNGDDNDLHSVSQDIWLEERGRDGAKKSSRPLRSPPLTSSISHRNIVSQPRRKSPAPPVNRSPHGDGFGRLHRQRSPPPPPPRIRSPIPENRTLHGDMFGRSRRLRSPPPPTTRIRSPPPSRRSPASSSNPKSTFNRYRTIGLGERAVSVVSSVPKGLCGRRRNGRPVGFGSHFGTTSNSLYPNRRPAIDIVKGLEAKKARRREKLLQKSQLRSETDREKERLRERRLCVGRGAEMMRAVGLECMSRRTVWPPGERPAPAPPAQHTSTGFVISC